DLLDVGELDRQEDEVRRRGEELENLDGTDAASESRAEAERAARVAVGELRQKAARIAERLAEIPSRARAAVPAGVAGLRRELAETTAGAQRWGSGPGAARRRSPGRAHGPGRRPVPTPQPR